MKQNVNFYAFRDAFIRMDRQDNFPGNGLSVLWDYLEAYEDETGAEIELDVVALCCDFAQSSFDDIAADYGIVISDCDDEEEVKETVLEYLNENTSVVGLVDDDEVIYQQF